MSTAAHVDVIASRGTAGEQEPSVILLNGERLEVLGIDDRWYDPSNRYFRVAASDGYIYLLRFDAEHCAWSIVHSWRLDA